MTNKVWDVTPATNFMQRFVAQTNYSLTGMRVRGKRIHIQFVDSSMPLGTTDGSSYHLNPARDEAINDWTEKH